MTGFEYSTGAHMIMEGLEREGLDVFEAVRQRYDGKKRNPFDEQEFGHRYGRAMASWAGLLAWSGFQYSAVTNTLQLTPRAGSYFWSNGYAYGKIHLTVQDGTINAELEVLAGDLRIRHFRLAGFGQTTLTAIKMVTPGHPLRIAVVGDPSASKSGKAEATR
jgi:hypothetical protein